MDPPPQDSPPEARKMLYVFFDFEATGIEAYNDHITQIGARIRPSMKHLGASFETFVFTERKIAPKAQEVTGISNKMLQGAPPTKKALGQFFAWISKNRKDDEDVVLVAYNGLNYDFPMLFSELHRWEINIPRQLRTCGVKYLLDPFRWAKTNMEGSTLLHRRKNGRCCFTLESVHLALTQSVIDKAHTALADADALCTICDNEAFGAMHPQDGVKYCFSVQKLVQEFMVKRLSIDSSTRKNTKNKIQTLLQMTQKRKKRSRSPPSKVEPCANSNEDRQPKKYKIASHQ